MWPVVMVLMTVAMADLFASSRSLWRPRWVRWVTWTTVLLLAFNGVRVARARSTFELARGERRYIDVARFVASHTDENARSVLFSTADRCACTAGG
jgi:hypothetical protein